jgi:hypothetical protein
MKYLLVMAFLIAVIITTGCVSENKNTANSPTVTSIPSTLSEPVPVFTKTQETTMMNACDVSGSCTDLARRMKESLSDCSIYGENDPKCHNDCNMIWIEKIDSRCPS